LILGKIIKTVATRCKILRLKCTKIQNSAGAPPQTPWGAYSAPPDPSNSKERGWEGGDGGDERGGSIVVSKKTLK